MVNCSDLLAALNIVGMESDDGRMFRSIGGVSDVIATRFPALGSGAVDLAREFPFLASYVEEAEAFWRGDSHSPIRSGTWSQADATGAECQLEATALRGEAGRRVLLLEILGTDFAHLQGILQSAREQTLAMEQLERAQAALRAGERELKRVAEERRRALVELEQAREHLERRVAERTAELTAANQQLSGANRQLLEYQEQLRRLVEQLAVVEERERRRISTYLHDHVGQSLALVRIKLGSLGRASRSREADRSLSAVQELVERTIDETRTLTFELGSPILYELGLESALESLTNRFKEDHAIPAQFVDDGEPKPVSNHARSLLYQSARELLHNIVKHARARRVLVSASRVGESIELVVEDQGAGFDASNLEFRVTTGGGFGLFNIRERLDHLGGSIDVRSRPGEGTRVTLRAPLAPDTRGEATA